MENNKIKILAIADEINPYLYDYFDKSNFSDIDLILSAGDLRPRFLSFLVSMLNKRLFYVRGNHDIIYIERPPLGCENIDGKIVEYQGIKIMGLEGSMWYGGRGVEYTEGQMNWKVFKLRPRIFFKGVPDIVLTHASPQGVHDGKDVCHQGFKAFRQFISRYQPRFFLHGHIHFRYGYSRERETLIEKTRVININGYYIFEVEKLPGKTKFLTSQRS